jgi:hypothetical protein
MRALLTLLALALCCLSGAAQAQDDPPAAPPSEAESAQEPVDKLEEEYNPAKRTRPVTEKEEDEYKRRAVREDPFLNAPPAPPGDLLVFYRPIDWLRAEVEYDRCTYLVQDAGKQLLGMLTINVEPLVDSYDSYVHLQLDYAAPKKRVEMWLDATTLKPRNLIKLTPPESAANAQVEFPAAQGQAKGKQSFDPAELALETQAAEIEAPAVTAERRTEVEYLFDRVTISRSAGIITTQERMRQLPYSFDVEQLPLLLRQLDFARLEKQWPFEALVTDPENHRTLPLKIDQPKSTKITSAEPAEHAVFELPLRLGDQQWTAWVERRAPYRLVKFGDGTYTYTLHQYEPPTGSY